MDDDMFGDDDLLDLARENAFLRNATATFGELEMLPPSAPLLFDPATYGEADRVDAPVLNPYTQLILEVTNIVYERRLDGLPPDRAYWVGRKLMDCIYGCIRICTILRFRNDAHVPWEVTGERAVVKVMSWQRINELHHAEDPIKEVAALQYVNRDGSHDNVMSVKDVLQDDEYLLIFMPYYSSGSLYDFVSRAGFFPERVARYWFKQILEGVSHLHKIGVCHRDLSLENIVVDNYTKSVVIDLGMCLRVPYHDDETGGVTDVNGGSIRRLITPSGTCGKLWYMAPEILRNDTAFDSMAVDLWGAAVLLFIMLVGRPPWAFASHQAPEYRLVTMERMPDGPVQQLDQCGIGRLLQAYGRDVSPLAADLLQRIFREDPRERYTLMDVQDHLWMQDLAEAEQIADPDDPWRDDEAMGL